MKKISCPMAQGGRKIYRSELRLYSSAISPTFLLSPIFQLQMSFHLLHPPCALRKPQEVKTYFLFAYMTHLWERHASLGACSNMDLDWHWKENRVTNGKIIKDSKERKAKMIKHKKKLIFFLTKYDIFS